MKKWRVKGRGEYLTEVQVETIQKQVSMVTRNTRGRATLAPAVHRVAGLVLALGLQTASTDAEIEDLVCPADQAASPLLASTLASRAGSGTGSGPGPAALPLSPDVLHPKPTLAGTAIARSSEAFGHGSTLALAPKQSPPSIASS